jgi:hypothetical protein
VFSAQPRGRICALTIAGALALAGCGSTGAEPGAAAFVNEHAAVALRAGGEAKAVEAAMARSFDALDPKQQAQLVVAASKARRDMVAASEWDDAEGGVEENLQQAEAESIEGASHLAIAMAAARSFASRHSASALARYRSQLAYGRQRWDEGVFELWYLAHRHDPPTI